MTARRTKALRNVVLACAVGSFTPWAVGQTWISPISGVWSNPANWNGTLVPGPVTDLVFPASGTQTYVATDDFPGPFMVHGISFSGSSTGNLTVASGSLSSIRFAGSSPLINNTAFGPVFLSGRARLDAIVSINVGDTAPNPTNIDAALSGTGGLIINSAGGSAVVLTAGNRFTGAVTLNAGRLDLGAQTSLASGNLNANGGVLGSSLTVTPSGNPPFAPVFANSITTSGSGLTIGGVNGYTLSGPITGTGGVSLSPSNDLNATWTLSGNNTFSGPLSINGSSTPGVTSTLVINSPASLGNAPTINLNGAGARLAFVAGSSPITINTPLVLSLAGGAIGAQNITTTSQVTYAGNISGSGGLMRTHGGIMTLSGTNTFSGPLTLMSGTTIVSSDANLGGGASSLVLGGGALMLNPAFGTTNRSISVTQNGSTVWALGDATFSGVISNALPQTYTKAGAGNLILTASNTYTGTTVVSGGGLTAAGPLGRFNNGAATITVNSGGLLTVDNTAAVPARLASGSTIALQGGGVRMIGNGSLNSVLTTTGQLVSGTTSQSGAGLNVISAAPAPGANSRLTFGSLVRTGNNGSMLLFSGPGLGANTTASNTPGATNITFNAAPAMINGILPYAIADASGGPGTDFATYLAANGVQPLAVYAPDLVSGATTNASVGNASLPVGGGTINALKMTGGTVDATNNLRVTSGAILAVGPSTISGGTLTIGTATTNTNTAPTANFFTIADLTVSSRIANFIPGVGQNSGIAKSGPAILTLVGPQTYSGNTRILQGTLRVGSGNGLPTATEVFISPGAMLDLNGFSSTIGSLNQTETPVRLGNNPHSTVNIGAASLTVGGDNLSTTINLNITGTGTLTKTGLGSMTVIGNQAFTGTVNIANGGIALATHLTDGTGLRNATRINLGTAVSGDVTLAFEHGLKDGFSVPITVGAQVGRVATIQFASSPAGTPGVNFASPIALSNARGVVIDASGGMTLSGVISGVGPLVTMTSADSLANGPDSFALNITGANTYTGTTNLTAISTLWGNAQAFGSSVTAIGLGNTNGPDNPEMSSSVGGLTLTRNISVNDSLNAVAQFAVIGSQAPAGSGTTTYSGNISINGSRQKLILYSRHAPVAFTGTISGVPATANVQIGDTLGPGLEWTNSNVTLSGANTYAGGTQVLTGSLNFGSSTAVAADSGQTILSGPVGTGPLTIGATGIVGAAEPTLSAVGAPRTVANPVVVSSNFAVAGNQPLMLSGQVDLNAGARVITVDASSPLTISGPITGAAGSALVKEGPGQLVLSGTNSYAGPTVAAGGNLTFAASQNLGGLLAVAGGASANLSAGGNKVLVAPSVSVETITGSKLDLADNNLIVDHDGSSPIAQITALVGSAYNGGPWTGPGITSSAAAASGGTHGLGIGEASDLGITMFAGQPVDADAVLLRFTRYGDADLNGVVNLADFNRLATNFGATGKFWHNADFNYDGNVNLIDFNRLAANFGLSAAPDGPTPEDWSTLAASVPEPSYALMAGSLLPLLRRRRRGVGASPTFS